MFYDNYSHLLYVCLLNAVCFFLCSCRWSPTIFSTQSIHFCANKCTASSRKQFVVISSRAGVPSIQRSPESHVDELLIMI